VTQKQRRAIALKIIHRTDLKGITKTETKVCHVCGKPDWCMVYINPQTGVVEADLCNRSESTPDHLTQEGKAIFVRWDKWDQQSVPLRPAFKAKKSKEKRQPKKAKDSSLNRVYRQMLSQLKLSDQHQQQLVDRGLTIEQVKKLGYRTAPTYSQIPALIRSLKNTGIDLLSVPGFYLNKQGYPWLMNIPGLWIPYHNHNNQIVGMQIRLDQTPNSGKYVWLSASGKGGVNSNTPIHVAREDTDTAWITEGALKADLANAYLNQTVVAMAGVSSYKEDELQQTLQQMDIRQVVIAFDADKASNANVLRAEDKLAKLLIGWGYQTFTAEWDETDGKGIDDLLVAGGSYQLQTARPRLKMQHPGQEAKFIRQKPNLAPISTADSTVEQVRKQLPLQIDNYLQQPEPALLQRIEAGVGKTTTTLRHLSRRPDNRLIYFGPRHQVLDDSMAKLEAANPEAEMLKLRPRTPRDETIAQESKSDKRQAMDWFFEQDYPLADWNLLCFDHQRAEQLTKQNYSVVANLCLSCPVGQAGKCGHQNQFKHTGNIALTHEYLTNSHYSQTLFTEDELWKQPPVVVVDEPSPQNFINQLTVTVPDLSLAIGQAQSEPLLKLLQAVRQATESSYRDLKSSARGQSKLMVGAKVMKAIIQSVGDVEQLARLVAEAESELPYKQDQVLVSIDGFHGETSSQRSYIVEIDGQRVAIPKSVSEPANDVNLIRVQSWYAQDKNLPIEAKLEADEVDLPLYFQPLLLETLAREVRLYQDNMAYNSALSIGLGARGAELIISQRTYSQVPAEVPLILLDAYGDSQMLSHLFNRPVKVVKHSLPIRANISQVINGAYGKLSLWKKGQPTTTLNRILQRVILPRSQQEPEQLLILTWKVVAKHLLQLQAEGLIPKEVAIDHFGNLAGSNQYEQRKRAIIIGRPALSLDQLEQLANALYQGQAAISMAKREKWVDYNYRDHQGNGYQVKVKVFVDPRVEALHQLTSNLQIQQALHRIRAVNHQDREVLLLTNVPLPDIQPTALLRMDELETDSWNLESLSQLQQRKQLVKSWVVDMMQQQGYLALRDLKPVSLRTFLISAYNDSLGKNEERQALTEIPPDKTLQRWISEWSEEEGWSKTLISLPRLVEQGGGTTNFNLYSLDPLDEEAKAEVEASYHYQSEVVTRVESQREPVTFYGYSTLPVGVSHGIGGTVSSSPAAVG